MDKSVLIVDDALFMRNMLRDIFSRTPGCVVAGEAANGAEAVEKYRELRPDLVTMDIVMPLKSGLDALEEIMSINADAKVVMCSALGQEALILDAVKAGAKDFIVKPFQEDKVREVVSRVLGLG